MGHEDARSISTAWFYKEHFGFRAAPPLSDPEVVRNMALALLGAAGGDGDLTADERAWIVGYLATKGYPDAVLDEVRTLSRADHGQVADLMQLGILRKSGRILIYDAVRAASVDGYGDGERAAVRQVAAALGVDEAAVQAIEALVADEAALKQRRIAALMPDGHPNL